MLKQDQIVYWRKSNFGLRSPKCFSGTIPINLYEMGSIIQTDEYPPFTKKLTVCGITLIARDDVSDVFMMRVGQTIGEKCFQFMKRQIR